jgi:hypothetical protein
MCYHPVGTIVRTRRQPMQHARSVALALALLLAGTLAAHAATDARSDTTWVTTFDHDFYNWADPHTQTFELPRAGLPWGRILLFYRIECPPAPGDCDPWDRLGHLRVVETDTTGAETLYEIARIITPYDITGGNYPGHCEWVLDVSDYASLLHDTVTLRNYIESWIGGQRGWLVTIRFAFIPGVMPLEPYRVVNLYQNDYVVYGDPANPHESHLPPLSIPIDAEAVRVKARAICTGHGQGNTDNAAEFARKWHEFLVGTTSYNHTLWRNDCAQNPCSPQGGTWYYARAGWCPGDKVDPWDSDITASITPGSPATIDYNIEPYVNFCRPNNPECADGATCADCDYNYNGHTEPHFTLQAQLIFYREPAPEALDGENVSGRDLEIGPNRPNPFSPATAFGYEMPAPGEATVTIFTADGRTVRRLTRHHDSAGSYSFTWDGTDTDGRRLPSGTYFYEVRAGERQGVRRMVLLR